ncbi:MAG: hypothetical protein KGJ57_07570 [Sphingomonadales bacterium]|nr:hypothetical protein [Sphingomonadales bacterium]MDE2169271.1 hypothetical protein [Sphingomonadales bacterium]
MPKMTDRERLADLEARQRKMVEEVEKTRRTLRGKYAALVPDLPVEQLTEREFRDVLTATIRVGGAAAITALKSLPDASSNPSSAPATNPKSSRRDVPATSMA